MALFMKQDFAPPMFSRRWLTLKFRPNMLIYSRHNIIAILESGLLFQEDSVEVEQEAPDPETTWKKAGGCKGGWLTRSERNMSLVATLVLVFAAPPRNLQKLTLVKLASYMLMPVLIRTTHRSYCRGTLHTLLVLMRDYMSLVRRATACCREYATLHAKLASVTSTIESTQAMLLQQQTSLLVLMCRAGSSLLGNVPWLRGDVTCDFDSDNLMKVHHAYLVVQSTLLKNIALAHIIPNAHVLKLYKNHNERIYWIHNVLINHLIVEFQENFESLERMYRLLKNVGVKDPEGTKKLGSAINDTWLYSDIHTGVAKSCLEMRVALEKCSHLDMFLDSCATNKEKINLDILDIDIDEIIENVTKCLSTIQNSQIRLKKMQNKFDNNDDVQISDDKEYEEAVIVKIDDREPEIKDEVFYLVNTEDESVVSPVGDVVTGPGKKEKEASKIVLKELKRKLVKREDVMRERERQALAKTMPDLKNIPEFPRQINYEEYIEKKGFISKIKRKQIKENKLFKSYKHFKRSHRKCQKIALKIETYVAENDLPKEYFEANAKFDVKCKIMTFKLLKNVTLATLWRKREANTNYESDPRDSSATLSDSEVISDNHSVNKLKEVNESYKFSKKDLELSPSTSESDFDNLDKVALLNDVRRYRAVRKKQFPKRSSIDNVDESLKPIEYNFGTGLAMASVLQVNSNAKMPNMVQEEVFIGNGEVSTDSGNDEDA